MCVPRAVSRAAEREVRAEGASRLHGRERSLRPESSGVSAGRASRLALHRHELRRLPARGLLHPDLQVLAAQVNTAQTERQLAQANTAADWTVEASYSQRGPAYSNMLSIGVSIPLQLDRANRQDREVSAKQALVREAQARLDDTLLSHEADVRNLLNDWHNGKERVARFITQLVPLAQQRAQAVLTGYRAGKADLPSVLAARRDEIDTRLQALTVEQETARLWAQLNYLTPVNGTQRLDQHP